MNDIKDVRGEENPVPAAEKKKEVKTRNIKESTGGGGGGRGEQMCTKEGKKR